MTEEGAVTARECVRAGGGADRWVGDVVLDDGDVVRIRSASTADVDGVAALLRGLSDESRNRRFLSPGPCDTTLGFLSDLGTDRHRALVAESGDTVVGVVECIALDPGDRAEVAFAVADPYQHRGVGTALLHRIAALATSRGIRTLVASTLADNASMLAVFREAGYEQRRSIGSGVVDVELVLAVGTADRAVVPPAGETSAPASLATFAGALRAVVVVCGGPVLLLVVVLAGALVVARDVARGATPPPLAVALLAAAVLYRTGFVPWSRRWGTVAGERDARLPGDEFVARAGLQTTRAVTIDTTPERVWEWLAQIGADRAGFYSYSWLENVAGCRLRNADRVHPEWQQRRVGERVLLHPRNGIPITRFDSPWSFAVGGWCFALEARPGGRTRLMARIRVPRGLASWAYATLLELPHFVMERRMLSGIRRRAESAIGGP